MKIVTGLLSKVLVSRYTNTARAATGLNPGLTFVRSSRCPGLVAAWALCVWAD